VDDAYDQLIKIYNGAGATKPDHTIDIVGFSRGAAEAREFANKINREGIPDVTSARIVKDTRYTHGEIVEMDHVQYDRYFKADIRFLGLFDTVGSIGIPGTNLNSGYDLSIPPNVQPVR